MYCIDALKIGDGREIWLMNNWPVLKRWEHGEKQLLSKMNDEITGPMIRAMGDDSDDGRIEFKNDNTINVRAIDKCIMIDFQEPLMFRCSLNMTASASTTQKMKKNTPCNPALEKPTTFYFEPNDSNPTITFSITMGWATFSTIEVIFTKKVKEVGIKCFSARKKGWWFAGNYLVNGTKFFTGMLPEFCGQIEVGIVD